MSSRRLAVLLTGLALAISACGPRGSGYAPAENALSATPEDIIVMNEGEYELPEAREPLDGPVASAATGDASSGQNPALGQDRQQNNSPATETDEGVAEEVEPLQEQLEDTSEEVAEAVAENQDDPGVSTTLTDELNRAEPDEEVEDAEEVAAAVEDNAVDDDAVDDEEASEAAADDAETDAETDSEAATTEENEAEAAQADPEAPGETAEPEASEADTATDPETDPADDAPETTDAPGAEDETEGTDAALSSPLSSQGSSQRTAFDWQALGEETYSANCSACHQASGEGIPPAFPPLAGHLSELYNLEGARVYLIHVLLYGLQGEIEVNGQAYNGVMPAWPQLSNEQIAAVLNHELTSWDNESLLQDFEPILPDEVAAERDLGLSAAQVLEARPTLP